jgi:hypothetical protein
VGANLSPFGPKNLGEWRKNPGFLAQQNTVLEFATIFAWRINGHLIEPQWGWLGRARSAGTASLRRPSNCERLVVARTTWLQGPADNSTNSA